MKHIIRPLIIILVIVGVAAAGYWTFIQNSEDLNWLQQQLGLISEAELDGEYSVSGYIEVEEVTVAAETSGRIRRVAADEGEFVQANQVLVELDTALLEAEVAQAQAKINTMRAQLARVKAGVRAEEIAKAEAAVAMAQANATAAHTLWQNATILRDNPQELDMQIDAARTALELAELKITSAIPLKDAGEALWELRRQQSDFTYDTQRFCGTNPFTGQKICKTVTFPEGVKQDASVAWNLAGADMWAAWVDLNSAVTVRADAEIVLNDLLRLRNDPQAAQIKVIEAEAGHQTALAEVAAAAAQLELLRIGTRPEEIAVAQAQVEQAEANLAALNTHRDKHVLTAPLAGWVVERVVHEGETAVPGASLMTLADLTDVTLTVYVPEPDVDIVSVGQEVDVFVDAFPGEAFTGHVTFINDEAEFTPKNVQTRDERINTVFAVRIQLNDQDQRLKPGMPADVILATGERLWRQ
jgi:multidrug resistance efflux pump